MKVVSVRKAIKTLKLEIDLKRGTWGYRGETYGIGHGRYKEPGIEKDVIAGVTILIF
ncbi:MAG: hypothetical protein Q8P57_04385 [Candidatus Pacearchaeota archaeon]|nr:hypothetical protein [Candidatus Pacearchaeota archaeon]